MVECSSSTICRAPFAKAAASTRCSDNVSARIEDGEAVAIIGRSGSGKSTLLNVVSGIDRADSGSVELNGREVSALAEPERTRFRRQHIGFIYSVLQSGADAQRRRERAAGARAEWHSRRRGAPPKRGDARGSGAGRSARSSAIDAFSGGEQQRVAIARALVHQPQLLLADEPTGNLDEETARQVFPLVMSLVRKRGATLLLVTHDRGLAASADRVLEMRDGEAARGVGRARCVAPASGRPMGRGRRARREAPPASCAARSNRRRDEHALGRAAFAICCAIRRNWRCALLGLALGVGTIIAVDIATASSGRAFELSMEAVNGAATHEIRGGPGGVDESLYVRLKTSGISVALDAGRRRLRRRRRRNACNSSASTRWSTPPCAATRACRHRRARAAVRSDSAAAQCLTVGGQPPTRRRPREAQRGAVGAAGRGGLELHHPLAH